MKKLLVFILMMMGFAQAQSTHSVTLSWTASPDAGANPTLSYNVYRAVAACSTNPTFTKINSTAAGVTGFVDTTVAVGETLCYTVTAVLNGLESTPAASAQAVILPSSPTNLQLVVK